MHTPGPLPTPPAWESPGASKLAGSTVPGGFTLALTSGSSRTLSWASPAQMAVSLTELLSVTAVRPAVLGLLGEARPLPGACSSCARADSPS